MEAKKVIDTKPQEQQRMIDVDEEEMWSPFLETINSLMLEEKKARQENDSNKGSEICCKIVSGALPPLPRLNLVMWTAASGL